MLVKLYVRKYKIVEIKAPKLGTTEYKTFNLRMPRGGRYLVQSRAEYRSQNLRPNGQSYN